MSERYPSDAALLALTQDAETGVEYIPTGKSPYYLEFRKLIQRLVESTKRANDLRVHQDGDMSVGVRPGRCVIGGASVVFAGATGVSVTNNATSYIWLDAAGTVQKGAALPAARTTHVPLASVTAAAGAITSITDLRGEAMLAIVDGAWLGLTATAEEINQALDGISANVDAAALSTLTGGVESTADSEHRHLQVYTNANSETEFRLINISGGSSANIALKFDLPARLGLPTSLLADAATGWLKQRVNGVTYALVGVLPVQYRHEGALTATQTGKLIGVAPADGVVTGVVLSVGGNIDSSLTTDGVTATVKVNGVAVTSTDPKITKAAGSGFRSTAQGHGTAAVIKTDGTQNVLRGAVLTVDLVRTAAGTIASDASNVVVMVVIRCNQPE